MKIPRQSQESPDVEESPGVEVRRVDGSGIRIKQLGGIDPLTVPTLLRLAADIQEKTLLKPNG